ncbi:MAG: putative beta-lysine N-acetyltransferase [Peptococcaceae bacterium]|nr:putative beta-lysine N-acetyltransferase [Peptococcaceae bacterium]
MAIKGNPIMSGPDCWETIAGKDFDCRILLSPFNRRLTVDTFNLFQARGAEEMMKVLIEKALAKGLDKIWLKSIAKWGKDLLATGMKLEASIPGFYKGKEEALVLARFLSNRRKTPSNSKGITLVEIISSNLTPETTKRDLPAGVSLKWAQQEHCQDLAGLFSKVFSTYPFPVFDPDYIRRTMNNGTSYIMAWHNNKLVAASATELKREEKNAEMTDFATLPMWRGQGLANCLLDQMESRLKYKGYRCLYTIARSSSIGMNKVFAGAGYSFNGVLINNCNISGDFEDMHVWSKIL